MPGKKTILFFIFFVCLLFGGCAGNCKLKNMTPDQIVGKLQKGITNKVEVYHIFGAPSKIYIIPGEDKTQSEFTKIEYEYVYKKCKNYKLSLTFNSSGTLTDITFLDTN